VAQVLTEVLGRPIVYNSPGRVAFWLRLRKQGVTRSRQTAAVIG